MADLCELARKASAWLGEAESLAGQQGLHELWQAVEHHLDVEALTGGTGLQPAERALLSYLVAAADGQALQAFELADALRQAFCEHALRPHYQTQGG